MDGCTGACDNKPCKHGGFCEEKYRDFDCDCKNTAFNGQTCQEDVSINFDGKAIKEL